MTSVLATPDRALVDWWADTAELVTLVPADRVTCEDRQRDAEDLVEDGSMAWPPFVVVHVELERSWRSNRGVGYVGTATLAVVSSGYDEGREVLDAVRTVWNGRGRSLSEPAVHDFDVQSVQSLQDPAEGVWEHALTANVRFQYPR